MSISSSAPVYDYWHFTITDIRPCISLLIRCRFRHKIFRGDRDVGRYPIDHYLINISVIIGTIVSLDNDKMVFELWVHMMMTSGNGRYYFEIIYITWYAWSFVLVKPLFNPWSRYLVSFFLFKTFHMPISSQNHLYFENHLSFANKCETLGMLIYSLEQILNLNSLYHFFLFRKQNPC